MSTTHQEPGQRSAFPVPMIPCDKDGGFTEVRETGLTVRQYFMAAALQGLLAGGVWDRYKDDHEFSSGGGPDAIARMARVQADAMLREDTARAQQQGGKDL